MVVVIEPLRDVGEVVLAVTLIEDVGDAAVHTFAVAGGIAPYSYTFIESQGLSVNAASGVLSYAGGAKPMVYVVTVSADDAAAAIAPITLLLTVEVSAVLSAALSDGAKDGVDSFVNLATEVGKITPSGGIGAYTFSLVSGNSHGYFTINSSLGVISVISAPESEDGNSYNLVWTLNDGDDRSPEVTGTVSVQFTKSPSAENALRYAVAGQAYNAIISVLVAGGVPDDTTGYTFALSPASGYGLASTTGFTIVLNANATYTDAGVYYVTVSIYDSQTPPQSGTFVLEVRVVSVLTFAPDSATSAIEGIEEVIDLTPYAKGGNIGNAAAGSELSFMVAPATDGFKVGNDNMLTVAAAVGAGNYTIAIVVKETNPAHQGQGEITIGVAGALSASGLDTAIVQVELSTEVGVITPSGGIGAYTFALVSGNGSGYFTINSSLGLISVNNASESEDGNSYILVWTLNDGDDRSPEVTGTVSVQFTKSPIAKNALRYVVVNDPYSETINIPVVGGVPDSTTGYTFALSPASGYSIGSTSGNTIVLEAANATYIDAGANYVTVSIHDSQTPPQSGTFVLEVRVVPVLAFSDTTDPLAIFQTESASLLSLVSGGNTDYNEATNKRTFQIVEGNDDGHFSIDSNGVLEVGISAPTVLVTLTVEVAETVPSQNATADVEVSVKFKASNVNLPGKPHQYTVDPADAPVTLVLPAAVGGFGIYTYSLGSNPPSYVRLSLNTLFVDAGLPSSGQAEFDVNVIDNDSTFPSGVSNADTAKVVLTFAKQLAKVIIGTGGKVEVDGTEYTTEGQEIEFDSTSSEMVVVKVLEGAAYITYPHSDPDRVWGISLSHDSFSPANIGFIDAYYLGPTEQGVAEFINVSYDIDLAGPTYPLLWAVSLADESVLRGQQTFIFAHYEFTNVWGPQPKGTYYVCPYIPFFRNYQCGPEMN